MGTRLATTWLCNLIDTAATLHLFFAYEGEELNPISAALLRISPLLFVIVKLVVMSGAVAFCWWKRDWPFCEAVSWVLFFEYLLLALYYLYVYTILLPAYA